ncbi:MAG: hypothetical protein Q9190_001582 [Brigantiaea leucoxantha]
MGPNQVPAAHCTENGGPKVIAAFGVSYGLACIVIILRFFMRLHPRNAIGWDDYMVLASLVIERTAIWLSRFIWTLIAFVAASHVVQFIIYMIACRPVAKTWDPRIHGLGAFTDIVCALVPICVVGRLQMNFRTKLALCILMGLGASTAGAAIAKAVTLKGLFQKDASWTIVTPAIWTVMEHYVGVIAASLPILRPLFKKVLGSAAPSPQTSRHTVHEVHRPEMGAHSSRWPWEKKKQSVCRDITKTTDFWLRSQTDLEQGRDRANPLSPAASGCSTRPITRKNTSSRASDRTLSEDTMRRILSSTSFKSANYEGMELSDLEAPVASGARSV